MPFVFSRRLAVRLQPAPEQSTSSWRAFLRAQEGKHARLRLPHRRDRVPATDLRTVLHLAGERRIEYIAATSNPDGRWTTHQARNLVMQLGDERLVRFLVHDRDAKFTHASDEIFRTEGMRVIRTPIQAPNANASADYGDGTLSVIDLS